MATKEEILDAIANMTVLELSELLKEFEEKFGVTAAAPVAVAPRALPPLVATPVAPPRSRTSSTSSSRAPATRRSRSSRRCVPSRTWG
jgi:ribosomal protein L7/L12